MDFNNINFFKENNMITKVFVTYMAIYPLFLLKLFYNSYFTLLQIVVIFGFFLVIFKLNGWDFKKFKYILLYLGALLIYAILHHWNALHFTSLVPGNFHYSWHNELLYFLKLSMPIFFIYILKYLTIRKHDYVIILKSWIILICGSIIITNILKISLGSYTDFRILGNVFDWFDPAYAYTDLASKGFFMYANQISCILICLLPITMYCYLNKSIHIFYLASIMATMQILGTRIGNLGSIFVFIGLIMMYLFISLVKRESVNKKTLVAVFLLFIIFLLMVPISPTMNRIEIYDYILEEPIVYSDEPQEKGKQQIKVVTDIAEESFNKADYIKEHYEEKLINPKFILESYPYKYDPEFWYDILMLPVSQRANYRYLEIAMVDRVMEVNDNIADVFFGITNERVQNIFNIERDFVLQYYAFGIIGLVIFLGIYFVLLIKQLTVTLKNFGLFNVYQMITIILFFGIAYLSGNIVGQISVFVPLLFIIEKPRMWGSKGDVGML